MPALPTLQVTSAQATRLLAVFNGTTDSNGNPLTPTQAYKRWLRDNLLGHVRTQEASVLQQQMNADIETHLAELDAALVIDPEA